MPKRGIVQQTFIRHAELRTAYKCLDVMCKEIMNTEKYCWEDAWLLLAVKYASDNNEIVSTAEVEEAGDFINHAIFEDSEMEHGITVLTPVGLLELKEGKFKLGPSFQELWNKSGAEKHRGVHKQLEVLCKAMGIT